MFLLVVVFSLISVVSSFRLLFTHDGDLHGAVDAFCPLFLSAFCFFFSLLVSSC